MEPIFKQEHSWDKDKTKWTTRIEHETHWILMTIQIQKMIKTKTFSMILQKKTNFQI